MNYHIVNAQDFKGVLPGLLCCWKFEGRKGSETRIVSCIFEDEMPEQASTENYVEEFAWERGWALTGNVEFGGYYIQYWWAEEREWCVREATPWELDEAMEAMKAAC